MSTKMTLIKLLAAALFALVCLPHAEAQHYQPFIDPGRFDPDFQFFAPVEVESLGGGRPGNVGWYASYNRMYVWMSRPELEPSFTEGDWTWGNRYDIGYMTDDDHGWLFSAMHVDGPNSFDELIIPRVNRVNEDDLPEDDDDDVEPVFPVQDRNNIFTMQRDFISQNSLNVADISGFELNKTFRLDPYHKGGVMEPFFGFRYIKFQDFTRSDFYARFDDEGLPPEVVPSTEAELEQIIIDQSQWDNHMVGGQVGFRFYQEVSTRWTLSGELRVFAFQNFQSFRNEFTNTRILYGGVGTDEDVTTESIQQIVSYGHDAEFVWGTDVRAEAAFQLTRDVALMVGTEYMGFSQGIARGNLLSFNEEDLQTVHVTFGVSVNR